VHVHCLRRSFVAVPSAWLRTGLFDLQNRTAMKPNIATKLAQLSERLLEVNQLLSTES
jgi:hypothetical protein